MHHKELETILEDIINSVKLYQAKMGGFYPFAAMMTPDGKLASVAVGIEEKCIPEAVSFIERGLRGFVKRGTCKAVGICYDVRVKSASGAFVTEAACIFLEHQDGNAFRVLLPYKEAGPKKFTYGEMTSTRSQPKIFLNKD